MVPKLALLLLLVFAVSIGFGVVAPVLPSLLQRIRPGLTADELAWHVGLVTGLYTFVGFAFARSWGALSDRFGRRPALLAAMGGYLAAVASFPFAPGLPAAYLLRGLAGLFAAGVLPVVLAWISDWSEPMLRARRFALASMASLLGFLVGPMIGGALSGDTLPAWLPAALRGLEPLSAPFVAAAAVGALAWVGAAAWLRGTDQQPAAARAPSALAPLERLPSLAAMITLSSGVAFSLGSFEVALTLLGKETLGLGPPAIARMFMECSLVMIVVQALISFGALKRARPVFVIGVASVVLAAGFAALPYVKGGMAMSLAIAVIAAASGALSPLLSYWTSLRSEDARGAALGTQASAFNIGQAMGSASAGGLFGLAASAPFWSASAIVLASWFAAFSWMRTERPQGAR